MVPPPKQLVSCLVFAEMASSKIEETKEAQTPIRAGGDNASGSALTVLLFGTWEDVRPGVVFARALDKYAKFHGTSSAGWRT